MTRLHEWFHTPPGQYLLAWEREQFDAALADVFGYNALQMGQAEINALAANRMPHRWLALTAQPADGQAQQTGAPNLLCSCTALPFAQASLDLVVLPHTLELSADPHATLREVQRVLVHEGRVAIAGFNPASLWGWRQYRGHLYRSVGGGSLYLPPSGSFIAPWRLRDWLRLLQFELEGVSYGCWRPAVRSRASLGRFAWMDALGRRWWPVLGAAYFMVAVKRSHGAKLVSAAWKSGALPAAAPVPVAGLNRGAPQAPASGSAASFIGACATFHSTNSSVFLPENLAKGVAAAIKNEKS